MKKRKVNRLGHEGKNFQEKEVYRKFLNSNFELEKTEPSPIDTDKTDESSFDEEETSKMTKRIKKTFPLKLKDFLYNNWVASFTVGIIVIILGGYIKVAIKQGIQEEQITVIKKDVGGVVSDIKGIENNLNSFKKDISVFKAEVSKDLEYIKKGIGF